ncbi:conserved Plasmodium protein, unknown function [Plasmodium sp. gorilla clade G1]|nr:conserved Plasmodium protein, unknown function [Plasmodium sp. gorilla clade G1]
MKLSCSFSLCRFSCNTSFKVFNRKYGNICTKGLFNSIPKNKRKEMFFFLNDKKNYFNALYNKKNDKKDLMNEMDELYDNILTCNWNDSFNFVLNVPIWEGILNTIDEKVKAYEYDEQIIKKKKELNQLLDILFILEDIRDHINELLEQSSRSKGLAGAHIMCSFEIQNMNEHIELLKKKYEELLLTYPLYKYQIDLVLGRGLALLRQRYVFDWKYMHEYFF